MPDGIEIPAWLGWLIVAGAALGAGRVVLRTRVVSWLTGALTRTIVEQITEIVRTETVPLRDELRPNGGRSLRDAVDRVEAKLDEHVAWSAEDRAYLHQRLNGTIQLNELDDPEDQQ